MSCQSFFFPKIISAVFLLSLIQPSVSHISATKKGTKEVQSSYKFLFTNIFSPCFMSKRPFVAALGVCAFWTDTTCLMPQHLKRLLTADRLAIYTLFKSIYSLFFLNLPEYTLFFKFLKRVLFFKIILTLKIIFVSLRKKLSFYFS